MIITNWEHVWIPRFDDGSTGTPKVYDKSVSFDGCDPINPFGAGTGVNLGKNGPENTPSGSKLPLPLTIPERAKVNGCGTDEINAPSSLEFEACDFHDICWTTFGASRSDCDVEFLARMVLECSDSKACYALALTYYAIVSSESGDPAWRKAQSEARTRKFYTGRDN